MYSAVIICASSDLNTLNTYFENSGKGETFITVPLSNNDIAITHYGCRVDLDESDKLIIGTVTTPMISDFSLNEVPYDHFARVIAENNMSIITT